MTLLSQQLRATMMTLPIHASIYILYSYTILYNVLIKYTLYTDNYITLHQVLKHYFMLSLDSTKSCTLQLHYI